MACLGKWAVNHTGWQVFIWACLDVASISSWHGQQVGCSQRSGPWPSDRTKLPSGQNHGAGDLLEVHGPTLTATVLLPFTLQIVPTVDLDAGRIVADPPEGLF